MQMNKYRVTIERTSRSWVDIDVEAETLHDARALAYDRRAMFDYSVASHEYELTEVEAIVDASDYGLSADQLDAKYNPDGDGEHPLYTRKLWQDAVHCGLTIVGYWDWVEYKLELQANK